MSLNTRGDPPIGFSPPSGSSGPGPGDGARLDEPTRDPPARYSGTIVVPRWLSDFPYWAISALIHAVVLFALLLILRPLRVEEAVVPARIRLGSADEPLDAPVETRGERPLVNSGFVPQPTPEDARAPSEESEEESLVRGTDLDLADLERDARMRDLLLGPDAGGWGPLGERRGKRSLLGEGGSGGTERAVRDALDWLLRHQNPDGSWSSRDFILRCAKDGSPCTNRATDRYGSGIGNESFDVGVTGLAVLAFTGHGYTHRHGALPDYVRALKRAVHYLKSVQVRSSDPDEDGRFGPLQHRKWMYDQAIATLALGELLILSGDLFTLKRPVERGVRLCLRAQRPGRGWRYEVRDETNDSSITGWMVLSLKTARHAGLNIADEEFERAISGALAFFEQATDEEGRTGYERAGQGDNRGRWSESRWSESPFDKEISCNTSVSVLCRLFAGVSRSDPLLRKGVDILLEHPPRWIEAGGDEASTINYYYWYHATYSLFQYGGGAWRLWNRVMKESLLESQRREAGCEHGSWDPIGEWANQGGRVYSTAMAALTLEVYYRYRRQTRADR